MCFFESRAPAKFALVRSLAHFLIQNGAKDRPPMSNSADYFFQERGDPAKSEVELSKKIRNCQIKRLIQQEGIIFERNGRGRSWRSPG